MVLAIRRPSSDRNRSYNRYIFASIILFLTFVVISDRRILVPRSLASSSQVVSAVIPSTTDEALPRVYSGSLRDDLLLGKRVSANRIWESLLALGNSTRTGGQALEVGMFVAKQCLQAAEAGLDAHCVEPSPTSFKKIERQVREAPEHVQQRIHLYNVAAGSSSGEMVPFTSSGKAVDHVGKFDVWSMSASHKETTENAVYVPTMKMDEIVTDRTFVVKIDTQGYEPHVFAGLKDSLSNHKIPYLITEYWPRGIDFLANQGRTCVMADVLQDLVDYGYTLYALPIGAHKKTVPLSFFNRPESQKYPPMHNVLENCRWFYQMEVEHPAEEHVHGFWSDVFAIAPGYPIPPNLLTSEA